jgi:hypothetical protein
MICETYSRRRPTWLTEGRLLVEVRGFECGDFAVEVVVVEAGMLYLLVAVEDFETDDVGRCSGEIRGRESQTGLL